MDLHGNMMNQNESAWIPPCTPSCDLTSSDLPKEALAVILHTNARHLVDLSSIWVPSCVRTPGMLSALRVLDTLRSLLIPSRFGFYLFMHTERFLKKTPLIITPSLESSWLVLLRMIDAQCHGKVVNHQLSKSLYPARLTKKHWM